MIKSLTLCLLMACLAAGLFWFPAPGKDPDNGPVTVSPRVFDAGNRVSAVADAGSARGTTAAARSGHAMPEAAQPDFLWAAADLEANPDPGVREQAVFRLEESVNPLSLTLIEGALEDPDPAVREAAIDALMEIGDEVSTRILIHAYFSQPEALREEIVHALAEIGGAVVAEFLLTAGHDENAAVREAALSYQAMP